MNFILGVKINGCPSNLNFTVGVIVSSYHFKFHNNGMNRSLEFSCTFLLRWAKVAPFGQPPKSWNFQNVIFYDLYVLSM